MERHLHILYAITRCTINIFNLTLVTYELWNYELPHISHEWSLLSRAMYFRALSTGRCKKKESRSQLNALVTVLFLLSSGVALVNLWDVKQPTATAPRRRKRWWRSAGSARELDIALGKYVSSGLFVMLHLSQANGWPFKTSRCHFRALQNALFFTLIGG